MRYFLTRLGRTGTSTATDLFTTTSSILTRLPGGGSNLPMMSESYDGFMSLSLSRILQRYVIWIESRVESELFRAKNTILFAVDSNTSKWLKRGVMMICYCSEHSEQSRQYSLERNFWETIRCLIVSAVNLLLWWYTYTHYEQWRNSCYNQTWLYRIAGRCYSCGL